METVSDGQISFYTWLQLPTKNGTKLMTVKIDPGAQVNTTPLSRYWKLYPTKLMRPGSPSLAPLALLPHTWISHDGSLKPFLGHFIVDAQHAALPRSYPTWLYVFEDATSHQIILSFVTLEMLGILEFKKFPISWHTPTLTPSVSLPYLPQVV